VSEEEFMIEGESQHLRVLIANERAERLERVAVVVVSLGHTVIARELNCGRGRSGDA
jgi:hypothetical protein